MGNSGLSRINYCNSDLIVESTENIICSDFDIIDEPEESLSDKIIVGKEVNCDTQIVENTDDNNGNIVSSNCFRRININETFKIEKTFNIFTNNIVNLDSKINDGNNSILLIRSSHRSSTKAPTLFSEELKI